MSLIFAGNYPDNPGSIFGHTFLKVKTSSTSRLQTGNGKRSEILDYAVNYAAAINDEGSLLYAMKGLFGGYNGFFSLDPYYVKVNDYSEGEGRDIWEYELNLTPDETAFILAQYWELRYQARFTYYFLDDNCSYLVLKMIDVTRPDWNLITSDPGYVIPLETVKVLKNVPGAIRKVNYRPSIRKKAQNSYDKLSYGDRKRVLSILGQSSSPEKETSAEVLNTVVLSLFSKRSQDDGKTKPEDQHILDQSLLRLSKLDTSKLDHSTPLSGDPVESHDVKQIGLGFGHQEKAYYQFHLRPGLHDLTDFSRGYLAGSELIVMDTKFRFQDEKFTVQHIDAFNLGLLRPTTLREKSYSWRTRWSYQNNSQIFCNFCKTVYGEALIGLAQRTGESFLTYILAGGFIRPSSNKWKDASGGGQTEFGAIAESSEKLRFIFSVTSYLNMMNAAYVKTLHLLGAGVHYNYSKDMDVNLTSKSGILLKGSQEYESDLLLSADYHF